jgi:hypothetical protein
MGGEHLRKRKLEQAGLTRPNPFIHGTPPYKIRINNTEGYCTEVARSYKQENIKRRDTRYEWFYERHYKGMQLLQKGIRYPQQKQDRLGILERT